MVLDNILTSGDPWKFPRVNFELQLLQNNDIVQAYQFTILGNFQGPKGLQIGPSL